MSKAIRQQAFGPLEVQRVDRPKPAADVDRNVDRLNDIPLKMARFSVEAGRAVREAIGTDAFKTYGDPSFIAKVCSGEKVPEYLAKIFADPKAKRRFGLAVLSVDDDATVSISLPPLKKAK